jgi:peptidoglycan/xylan/chitin deacetylase (PgdA/CDA1 family)
MTKFSDLIQLSLLATTKLSLDRVSYPNQILCYHSVSNDGWQYSVSETAFESQLSWLMQVFEIVPLSLFLKNNKSNSKSLLALTFDDGYSDIYHVAFPIMQRLGLVGTVFLCKKPSSNLINPQYPKSFMTKKMIQTLESAGWSIGYHTRDHSDLSTLTSDELLDTQIKPANYSTKYFAYPMGHYDRYSSRFVAQYYQYGFTTDPISFDHSPLTIPRTMIEHVHSELPIFQSLLTAKGLGRYHYYTRIMRFKARLFTSKNMPRQYYPPRISEFRLEKPFDPEDPSDSYYFGYYQKKSKLAFVKFWSATRHNLRYRWLQNEANFYRIFWSKLKSRLSQNQVVTIPHYYESSFQGLPYLMIERIEAIPISKLDHKVQVKMIGQVLSFLNQVTAVINRRELRLLPRRGPLYWMLLMPPVTLGALLRHPSHTKTIFSLACCFLVNLPWLILRKERGIVHRDINEWNILKNKRGIILIDFQLVCYADPLIEIAIIMLKYYHQTLDFGLITSSDQVRLVIKDLQAKKTLSAYVALFTLYDFYLNRDSTPEALKLAQDYMQGNINI